VILRPSRWWEGTRCPSTRTPPSLWPYRASVCGLLGSVNPPQSFIPLTLSYSVTSGVQKRSQWGHSSAKPPLPRKTIAGGNPEADDFCLSDSVTSILHILKFRRAFYWPSLQTAAPLPLPPLCPLLFVP